MTTKRYQWCDTHDDGYPAIREMPGRRFGAAIPSTPMMLTAKTPVEIKPMKLLDVKAATPKRPGSQPLPLTAKLKPIPSVPATPQALPKEWPFCVHKNEDGTLHLRFRDPTHAWHGRDVTDTSECVERSDGLVMCHGMEGERNWEAPVCEQPEADREPVPRGCCYDIETSTLVCPGSAYDGLIVSFVEGSEQDVGGIAHVAIEHPDLPRKRIQIPVCTPAVPPEMTFVGESIPKLPEGEQPECCVELVSSTLQKCKDERLNGMPVNIKGEPGPKGVLVGIPGLRWKGYLPVCPPSTLIPEDTPAVIPDLCCYDPTTSSLVCEGTSFHGLVVKLESTTMLESGTKVANVSHARLPDGGASLIICESPPPAVEIPPEIPDIPPKEIPPEVQRIPERTLPPIKEPPKLEPVPNLPPPSPGIPENCCYSYTSNSLECAGSGLDGLKVRLVSEGAVKDGWPMVKVEHPHLPGGYAVVPVCVTDCGAGQRQVMDRAAAERSSEGQPSHYDRWSKMAQNLAHASDSNCSGRRFSATHGELGYAVGDGCIGSTGLSDRHKEYAPLPGLRGWQKGFEG